MNVEPQKTRSKAPRRGWSELIAEVVSFAKKANTLADLWQGDNPIDQVSKTNRKIAGFGAKAGRDNTYKTTLRVISRFGG